MLPTDQKLFNLQDEFEMPKNIKAHCLQVSKVAFFIASKLAEAGIDIDSELVRKAGLVHDIARLIDIPDNGTKTARNLREKYPGLKHVEAGYRILKDRYPEIARIVKKHAYRAPLSNDPNIRPKEWDEKVLCYADKRVAHNQIVTLQQRLAEGHERWKKRFTKQNPGVAYHDSKPFDDALFKLEKEIFDKLAINADDVNQKTINIHQKHSKIKTNKK